MTADRQRSVDVLVCAGTRDVHRLMPFALKSCVEHFSLLNDIVVISDVPDDVREEIARHGLAASGVRITVAHDDEFIPAGMRDWPGWCKQQVLRLHADRICSTPVVACLSADTILFRRIGAEHVFADGRPVLYFNRYSGNQRHLMYERTRVEHVARLLNVTPRRSLRLGDFIMDLNLLRADVLRQLRDYLGRLYGDDPFSQIVPRQASTLEQKQRFGEWTMYAVFLLDVLNDHSVTIRNSHNRFIAQVHSASELAAFPFDAYAVHFVDKSLAWSTIDAMRAKANT